MARLRVCFDILVNLYRLTLDLALNLNNIKSFYYHDISRCQLLRELCLHHHLVSRSSRYRRYIFRRLPHILRPIHNIQTKIPRVKRYPHRVLFRSCYHLQLHVLNFIPRQYNAPS